MSNEGISPREWEKVDYTPAVVTPRRKEAPVVPDRGFVRYIGPAVALVVVAYVIRRTVYL